MKGERSAVEAAIFAGDTNLRQAEVDAPKVAKGLGLEKSFDAALRPKGKKAAVGDAFESSGADPDSKYTWDLVRNNNAVMPNMSFQPRARYDRCYFTQHAAGGMATVPGSFRLVGTERFVVKNAPAAGTGGAGTAVFSGGDGGFGFDRSIFPSDHFGIVCDFDLTQ